MTQGMVFGIGEKYRMDGATYRIEAHLKDRTVAVRELATGNLSTKTRDELLDAWSTGRLRGERHGPNLRTDEASPLIQTRYEFPDLQAIPERYQELARQRHALIEPLLVLSPAQRTPAVVAARSAEFPDLGRNGQPVHVSTVWRWMQAFTDAGGDLRALVPGFGRRGPRGSQLDPTVRKYLDEAKQEVYLRPERPSATVVQQALDAKIVIHNQELVQVSDQGDDSLSLPLSTPALSTVTRFLNSLDPVEADTARYGRAHAMREHHAYGDGPRPTRPNQRWEADHTFPPILLVDDTDWLPIGLPTLALIRDKYTGYPVGMGLSFEPASYLSVMECLLYAILPKDHVRTEIGTQHDYLPFGVPEALIVDNGKAFIGRDLDDACLQLGIELIRMPPGKPWYKAIERWFEIEAKDLTYLIPGTTFSNILERGDYRPEQYACMTLDSFWVALHKWIVDIYAQSEHKGIGDSRRGGIIKGIPARLWERALTEGKFTPRIPPAREDLIVLISRIEDRVIQPYGIDFEGMRYQTSEFAPVRSRLRREQGGSAQVRIKYHPGDLSCIWVLHPFENRYIEAPVANEFREYANHLSLWTHRVIRRYVREELHREVDHVSLALARLQLQAFVAQCFQQAKNMRARTRQRAARFSDKQVSAILRGAVEANGSNSNTPSLSVTSADHADHSSANDGTTTHEARASSYLPVIAQSPMRRTHPENPGEVSAATQETASQDTRPDTLLSPLAGALLSTPLPPLVADVTLEEDNDKNPNAPVPGAERSDTSTSSTRATTGVSAGDRRSSAKEKKLEAEPAARARRSRKTERADSSPRDPAVAPQATEEAFSPDIFGIHVDFDRPLPATGKLEEGERANKRESRGI